MASFYRKSLSKSSLLFFIIVGLITFFGAKLRLTVGLPVGADIVHANFLNKFFISKDFVLNNIELIFNIELVLSAALIPLVYWLGKALVGKTCGVLSAIFVAFYPYFILNCYSTDIFFLIFFMAYLLFQLHGVAQMSKKYSLLAGVFFILSVIVKPACIVIGVVPYIYHAIKAKNIAVLYNFLFFLLGILIALSPFMLRLLIEHKSFASLIPLKSTFAPFGTNINKFLDNPLTYLNYSIIPFFKNTIAHPSYIHTYSYLHYMIITLSILGALYSFIEERVRVFTLIILVILIQALFMPLAFSYLFLPFILLAGYMIDKVVKDVLS